MTLAQWNASAQGQGNTRGAVPFIPTDAHTGRASGPATGAYVVPDCDAIRQIRTYLWNLSDYRVSSVTGGSIWLIPR
jgi:hypothetical protein